MKYWIVAERTSAVEINRKGELTLATDRHYATHFADRHSAENFAELCRRQGLKTFGGELEAVYVEER